MTPALQLVILPNWAVQRNQDCPSSTPHVIKITLKYAPAQIDCILQTFKRALHPNPLHDMQPPQMSHSFARRNILLVYEAASTSLGQAPCLKDAASTALDLIAAAQVRLTTHISVTACIYHTHLKQHAQCHEDRNLTHLVNDAVVIMASVWRSYLESTSQHLWPSRELHNIILDITVYAFIFESTLPAKPFASFAGCCI